MEPGTKKILLIVAGVGLLFVLLVGGIGGGIFWLVWKATAEPTRVAREHLEAINQGDYPRAYNQLSSALKADLSQERFTEVVTQNPQVFKTTDITFSNRKIDNDVCTLRGTVTNPEGGKTPIRVTLVKEGGEWRIRGFSWGEGATEEDET